MCSHLIVLTILAIAAAAICLSYAEGFRSQEHKASLAAKIVTTPAKRPEFDQMKAFGLDGAEFYEVRQLWNKNAYTRANVMKVL